MILKSYFYNLLKRPKNMFKPRNSDSKSRFLNIGEKFPKNWWFWEFLEYFSNMSKVWEAIRSKKNVSTKKEKFRTFCICPISSKMTSELKYVFICWYFFSRFCRHKKCFHPKNHRNTISWYVKKKKQATHCLLTSILILYVFEFII